MYLESAPGEARQRNRRQWREEKGTKHVPDSF